MFLKFRKFQRSLFLIKLQFWGSATLLKKTPTQVLSCEICKIFKSNHFEKHRAQTLEERDSSTGIFLWILCNFLESFFVEHLLATTSNMMLFLFFIFADQWSLQTSCLICTSKNWKLSQSRILNKDANTFLKISSFFRCYCHVFAKVNQLPGFSISRLANVDDFLNVNIFFKCKLNINVSINDHSLYMCSTLLKTSFLLPHLFCNVDF